MDTFKSKYINEKNSVSAKHKTVLYIHLLCAKYFETAVRVRFL